MWDWSNKQGLCVWLRIVRGERSIPKYDAVSWVHMHTFSLSEDIFINKTHPLFIVFPQDDLYVYCIYPTFNARWERRHSVAAAIYWANTWTNESKVYCCYVEKLTFKQLKYCNLSITRTVWSFFESDYGTRWLSMGLAHRVISVQKTKQPITINWGPSQ